MSEVVRSYASLGHRLANDGVPSRWGGVHGEACPCLACGDYRARPVVFVPVAHLVPPEGYMRRSAHRLGISFDAYSRRIEAGERWCYGHKTWHPRSHFGRDARNRDGINGACSDYATERMRRKRQGVAS